MEVVCILLQYCMQHFQVFDYKSSSFSKLSNFSKTLIFFLEFWTALESTITQRFYEMDNSIKVLNSKVDNASMEIGSVRTKS